MKFHVFMLPTIGEPHELRRGMAGQNPEHYQRMLRQVSDIVRLADEMGYEGIGFTEHHFHIEGFECSTNPILWNLYTAMQTTRVRVGQLGIVLPASNPIRVAEDLAMLDQMSGGRAYAGFARGYQARAVNTLAQHIHVGATRSDKSQMDAINRQAFEEALEIIKLAWTRETFSYDGTFWKIPADTPWDFPATKKWGRGVGPDGTLTEIGIVPRPLQKPHPPIYFPFAFSMSTARHGAKVGGIPVLLSGDVEFCKGLFTVYQEEAAKAGRELKWGESVALGGFLSVAHDTGKAEAFAQPYRWAHDEWFTPFGFPEGLEVIGDPDTISRQLEILQKALHFEEFFHLAQPGPVPPRAGARQPRALRPESDAAVQVTLDQATGLAKPLPSLRMATGNGGRLTCGRDAGCRLR